jgi:hypothetical protein
MLRPFDFTDDVSRIAAMSVAVAIAVAPISFGVYSPAATKIRTP